MTAKTVSRLFEICIQAVAKDLQNEHIQIQLGRMPNEIIFDLYAAAFEMGNLTVVDDALGDLGFFVKMLTVNKKRGKLITMMNYLVHAGYNTINKLINNFEKQSRIDQCDTTVSIGLKLGGFLCEIANYTQSASILTTIESMLSVKEQTPNILIKQLDCYCKLLTVQAEYYMYEESLVTIEAAKTVVHLLQGTQKCPNLVQVYATFCNLYLHYSEYDNAYYWGKKAMEEAPTNLSPYILANVLRVVSEACLYKKKIQKAFLLISEALHIADAYFRQDSHPYYGDIFRSLGHILLENKLSDVCVKIYSLVLKQRLSVFGENSIKTAIAYKELAYAQYKLEVSDVREAAENSNEAYRILISSLPENHFLIAFTEQEHALIFTLIAYMLDDETEQKIILDGCQKVHTRALATADETFRSTNCNIFKANFYRDIGNVKCRTGQYTDAEIMYKNALTCVENLYGADHDEVPAFITTLADLYNYYLGNLQEAEKLYIRSIKLNIKHFGNAYFSLVKEYKSLIDLYRRLNDTEKEAQYIQMNENWLKLRNKIGVLDIDPDILQKGPTELQEIKQLFNV